MVLPPTPDAPHQRPRIASSFKPSRSSSGASPRDRQLMALPPVVLPDASSSATRQKPPGGISTAPAAGLPDAGAALFLELRELFSKIFPESLDTAESGLYN